MKLYAYVDEGEIKKYFYKNKAPVKIDELTKEELAERKLFEVNQNKPSKKSWQRVGARTENFNPDTLTVEWGWDVSDKPLESYKQERIEQLRKNAENAIMGTGQYSAGIDPFLQKFDPRTAANAQDIKSVVDEYKTKKQEILDQTTHEGVEGVYIQIVAFVPPEDLDENGQIIVEDVI